MKAYYREAMHIAKRLLKKLLLRKKLTEITVSLTGGFIILRHMINRKYVNPFSGNEFQPQKATAPVLPA
jgi:hypothetical protein